MKQNGNEKFLLSVVFKENLQALLDRIVKFRFFFFFFFFFLN